MEDYMGEVPHCSQDYYPNYNLFQSSVFYDTDNFRGAYLSLRYDSGEPLETERSPEPPDEYEEGTPDAAVDGIRVITKEDLYKDPDLFQSKLEDIPPPTRSELPPPLPLFLGASQPWGYDWTQQSWVKGGGKVVVMNKKKKELKVRKGKQNLYNQLVNAPKISISKAESMMQKMGWQGGALGKGANGILEPITPDPIYCSSTIGFGQRTSNNKKMKNTKPMRTVTKKGTFRTNVLLYILDFVRDDTEIELLFGAGLRHAERRRIHMTVQEVINDGQVANLSPAQHDTAIAISEYNQYELRTISKGETPNRQLTIYKEAPENVYLVTPDDFLPEVEETDEQTNNEPIPDEEDNGAVKNDLSDTAVAKEKVILEPVTMELDDDENPFLKSIKKSIKDTEEPIITNKFEKDCIIAKDETVDLTEDSPKEKIVEFFVEFADSEVYKEFRFLGKFTEEQTSVINEFLNDIDACIDNLDSFKGNEEIAKVFKRGDAIYEMKDGCNGTVEIHKSKIQGSAKNNAISVN